MTKSLMYLNQIEEKAGTAVIENADGTFKAMVEIPNLVTGYLRGRPINPESRRQQELKAKAERAKANGGVKRGRPIVADSVRQQKLAEKAARIAAGEVIKRGRPKMQLADVLVSVNI